VRYLHRPGSICWLWWAHETPSPWTNQVSRVHEERSRLDAILARMSHARDPETVDKAKAFRPVWEDFKTTREQQIIQAVRAGRYREASAIAMGIQAERRKKMQEIMGCK
jgi:hypothetical protein